MLGVVCCCVGENIGLYGTVCGCRGLCRVVWSVGDYMGLYWNVWVCVGLYGGVGGLYGVACD